MGLTACDGCYEEISEMIVNTIFEPFLFNMTEDGHVTYCSNPLPSAFIISNYWEKQPYSTKIIDKHCFQVNITDDQLLSQVNLTSIFLESNENSTMNMVL